jgi:hypothetical protein
VSETRPYQKTKLSDNMSQRLVQLYDPWVFLEHCVFTQDEVDKTAPVKPAPIERPYLQTVVRCWEHYDTIIVDKARRMWISWLFLSLHLHMAMTGTNRRIGITSKKFDDAAAHLTNMEFIYKNIPESVWPSDLRPKLRTKQGFIYFDDLDTTIHALASGPDQARQYGFTALFNDEIDFWENQEATLGAQQPTVQGGGKIAIATTHAEQKTGEDSYYKKLLYDQIGDAKEYEEREELRVQPYEMFLPKDMTGLAVHQNKRNKWLVVELDFIADPKKRDPKWIAKAKATMAPKRWEIEMMRSWETFEGTPVYKGAWFRSQHVPKKPFTVDYEKTIFRGWDFGGNQSCAMCQLVDGQMRILDILPNGGKNTREFAPQVVEFCNMRYGSGQTYVDIVDPSAMWEGKTATGFSCAQVMREFGLKPRPARTNDPERRIDAVIYFMMKAVGEQRGLLVNPHCKMFIDGCKGGYHFPDKVSQAKRADRPVKNAFSHIHDAVQYVALYFRGIINKKERDYGRVRTQGELDYAFIKD